MIEGAWDEYRAWARRSRQLQADHQRSNRIALGAALAAALLGALAAAVAGTAGGKVFAGLAAVAAGLAPVLGRHILASGAEAGWIRARAVAEAMKSECYRVAARLPPYAGADAHKRLIDKRGALADTAMRAGLTSLPDPAGGRPDKRRPPPEMTADWYLEHRVREQQAYYGGRQVENEREVRHLRHVLLVLAVTGVVMGALGATVGAAFFAPWIPVLTTIGGLLVAHGAMERRQFLSASYGAMAVALGRLQERDDMGVAELVDETERLLQGEHGAWVDRMVKTIAPPPGAEAPASAAPKPSAPAPLFLEDLTPGRRFRSPSLPLAAVPDSLDGLAPGSPMHVAGMTMRLLVASEFAPQGGILGAGIADLHWPTPARPGEALHVVSEVLEVRRSTSRPDRGLAKIRNTTLNADEQAVQVMVSTIVIPARETRADQ